MKSILATRALHSRGVAIILAVGCIIAEAIYFFKGLGEPVGGDHGTALPSVNDWISSTTTSFLCAAAVSVLVPLLMLILCRRYNVLRSMTTLYITFFAVMQLSEPDLSVTFYGGSLLVAVMPLCLMLLFGCYRAPNRTRSVFLIFMLLSGLSAFQYCFLVYLPVFLIGCAQMRILNARTLVAALLGCITPWWILFGFGVIGLKDIHLPSPGSLTARIDAGDIVSLVSVGLTVLLVILSYVLNVLKAIAYNAQSRAINGSFATLTLFTILAIFLDFNNIASYIPLLNFCAAIQLAHFFSVHRAEKSWIAIASIMAVYIVLFICQTVI